jgi:hypothetical protein
MGIAGLITLSADGDAVVKKHGVLGAPSATSQLPGGFVDTFTELLAAQGRLASTPAGARVR